MRGRIGVSLIAALALVQAIIAGAKDWILPIVPDAGFGHKNE